VTVLCHESWFGSIGGSVTCVGEDPSDDGTRKPTALGLSCYSPEFDKTLGLRLSWIERRCYAEPRGCQEGPSGTENGPGPEAAPRPGPLLKERMSYMISHVF